MSFIKRNGDLKSMYTILRFYSSLARKTHYEVLNLRKNCSDKEIKEAFIQMSKEYHPDKNKDTKAQDKFVRIVEAYNVLSKPGSRAQYDNITEMTANATSYVYRTHVPYNFRNSTHYNYYETHQSNTAKEKTNPYYNMSGVKKLSNYYIIMLCCGVALIGAFLQVAIIRNLYFAQRSKAHEKSMLLAEELDKVRAAAKDNGNALQTRLLLDKIVTAANPTVATASLGQALANEKKESSVTLLTEFGISEATEDWSYNPPTKSDMKEFNVKQLFENW